jgi:hypothetical protein
MQMKNLLTAGLLVAIILCVGTALAQDFPPQTGTFIKGGDMNGMCRLDIINNGADDAVAYLSTMQKKIVAAVYIRGGDFFNLTGIDAGSYELYFQQGQSWSNSTGKFAINATSSRMEEPLTFETQKTPEGVRYTWGQVTLEEVPNGNAVVVPVSEEDFPV